VAAIVGLSLLAALLFASASAMQQRVAAREEQQRVAAREKQGRAEPLKLVRRLMRSRWWLAGWGVNAAGFFSQSAALKVGNVAVVQPLLTTQLLFAVPLATARTGVRPARRDWVGAAAVCAGLFVLLRVRGAAPLDQATPDRARFLATAPLGGAAVALLAVAALRPRRWAADRDGAARPLVAFVLGIAAGVCFAYSAALIVLTTADLFGPGVAATATDWPGYALAGSTAIGILLEQQAFSVGTLAPALAAMTITNPVVAYAIGVVAFHIPLPETWSAWAALLGAAVLVAAGVWLLANSPTAQRRPDSFEPSAPTSPNAAATAAPGSPDS
jgi:drug/metabolite transporter (DMT)-like permease